MPVFGRFVACQNQTVIQQSFAVYNAIDCNCKSMLSLSYKISQQYFAFVAVQHKIGAGGD